MKSVENAGFCIVSNAWKKCLEKFQWLEKRSEKVPIIGSFHFADGAAAQKSSNHWNFLFGLILAVLVLVPGVAQAFSRVLGGDEVENALRITCNDDGMRIEAFIKDVRISDDLSWRGQTYNDDKSSMIHYDNGGTFKYTAGYYEGLGMACTMNSNISDTVNRRIWLGGSVALTMDTTYVSPGRSLNYTFTISNKSDSVLSNLEFYHGQDTYLGWSDSGGGYLIFSNKTVGVKKPSLEDRSKEIYQQMVGDPIASKVASLGYYDVKLFVEQGNLGNMLNTNYYMDNGYAAQWNVGTLNPGETWTVNVDELFKVGGDFSLVFPATADIGVSTVVTGEVRNGGDSNTVVYLDATMDNGSWTSTISGLTSFEMAPGALSNILVNVSCPPVISVGEQAVLTVTLTNAAGESTTANTTLTGVYYDGVVLVENITDGAAPSYAGGSDFGGHPVDAYVTNLFNVYNGGPSNVTITSSDLTGDTGQFSVSGLTTPLTLGVGESTNIAVTYHYNGLGTHTAQLVMQDDKPWTPFTLNMRAYTWTISTNNGAKRGGNEVTLTNGLLGSGADINQVLVGGVNAEVVDQHTNRVTFIVPEQPNSGFVDIKISSISQGAKTMKDCYFVNPIGTFDSVSPATGDYGGGYDVTITGTNFCNGTLVDVTNVTFQGVPVTTIKSVEGSTQVVVTVASAQPGPANIVIESFTHGRCEMPGGFRFEGPLFFMDGKGGYAVNNNGSPAAQNGTDYGTAAVGASVVQSFYITNAESATLHVSSVSTNGSAPDAFTVVSLSTTNIDRSEVAVLKVAFTPQSAGGKSATILIDNDAPDAPFKLNLAGDAVAMSPIQGPYEGGQTVEISGISLPERVSSVTIGDKAATIVKQNSTSISFITPAASFPGQKDVTLVGDSFTNVYSKSYTYSRKGHIFGDATDDWTQWETLPDMPHGITPRSNYWFASVCEYDDYVMAVGGTWTGQMMKGTFYYDGFEWFNGPELPFGWAGMALAAADDTLHLMGGYSLTMYQSTSARSLGSNYVKSSWTFDGNSFVSNAPLNTYQDDKPMYMAGAYVNGEVYTIGGAYGRYSAGLDIYRQTNIYRLAGQEWVKDGGLPGFSSSSYGIYHGRTAVLSNKVYMVGGFGWSADYDPVTNAYVFDGTNCTAIAGLPYKQGRMAVGVASGQVYAAGGAGYYYNNYLFSNKTFRLDGSSWSEVPSLALPVNGGQFYGGATLDDRFYAIGPTSYAYPKRTYASGVSPTGCAASGGVTVTITGRDLCDGTQSDVTSVLLAGNKVASIDSVSSTQIVVTAAPGSGAVGDVVVTSVKYGQTVASGAFTYSGIGIQVLDADGNLVPANQAASASAGTAFGYVPSGTPVTNWFTIENTGDGLVTFSGLSTNGSDVFGIGDEFSLPATLAVGHTTNVPIVCDASAVGDHTGTLYFINDTAGASSNYPVNLSASVFNLSTNAGPFQGGQTITITNGVMGSGSDITAVYFYTFAATILDQGSNWVQVLTPATEWAMTCDVTVRSDSLGDTVLADAYTFREQAWIGAINYSDGTWKEMNGPAGGVNDMRIGPDGALYACGFFTNLCDGTYVPTRVAKYQYGVWTPVGTNVFSSSSYAIEFIGTNLFVGGAFYKVDTNVVEYMATYNGTDWVAVYTNDMDMTVYALATDGTNLYLGGSFDNWDSPTNVAVWNGTTLENIGNGITNDVYALKYHDGYLYAGTDGSGIGEFARWNGSTWQHLTPYLDDGVFALAAEGSHVYFGGYFTWEDAVGPMDYVGQYDGAVSVMAGGLSNRVTAMDTLNDGNIVAGYYQFGYVAGVPTVDNMAVWNGTGWVPCGNETAYYGNVDCIKAVYNGIYVAGDIRDANGGAISNCAFFAFSQTNTISPKTGSSAGGTSVTIPGHNLGNGTEADVYKVTICGTEVRSIDTVSSSQITVTTEAGSGGLGDVVVYTYDYGTITMSDAFTYAGPGIQVLGADGSTVQNGAAARVAAGTAGAAQTGSTQTNWLTITNAGSTLTITSVATNGANPELFHVIDMPASVAAGTTATFGIEFSPTALGSFSGGITINNNAEGSAGTYVINLTVDGYTITEDAGPWNGGNTITLTTGTIGSGSDITNVLVGGQSATIVSQSIDSVTFITPEYINAGAVNITIQSTSQGEKELSGVYTYHKGSLGGILEDWTQWEEKLGFSTTSYSRMPDYTRAAVYSNAIYAGGGKYYYFRYTNNATEWERHYWTTSSYYTNYDFVVFNDNLLAVGCSGRTNNFCLVGTNLNNQCMGMPNNIPLKWGGAEVINDTLHYVGGTFTDINRCGAYTDNKDTFWHTNAAPLSSYIALATASLSNRMYCIGGQLNNSTTPGYVYTNVFWTDDGVSWNLMKGIPEARRYASATAFRGQLYVMGGFTNSDYRYVNGNGYEASNVWRYTGSTWEEMAPLPKARGNSGAVVYNDQIWVMGGFPLATNIYAYPAHTLYLGAEPDNGVNTGGYDVRLWGTSLHAGTTTDVTRVTFGGADAEVLSVAGTTQVIVHVNGGPFGAQDVKIYSTLCGITTSSNAFTFTGADIAVLGTNGTEITTGEAASSAKGTDFGTIQSGQSLSRTLVITNAGNQVTTISGIGFGGTAATQVVTDASAFPISLAGTSSTNLTVTWTADGAGVQDAYLVISNSTVGPQSNYVVNLSASVLSMSRSTFSEEGGGYLTISNGAPLGSGTDITNVLFGTVNVVPYAQGSNWVTIVIPAGPIGTVSPITVQSFSLGDHSLVDAFEYVAASAIYGSTFTWTEISGLPIAMEYNKAFVLNDQLYSAGGYSADYATNVFRFDGIAWHEVEGLPAPRAAGMGAVLNGVFYYMGGDNGGTIVTNVYRYDGTNWTESLGLPKAISDGVGGNVGGKVVVAGGWDVGYSKLTNCYVFDGTNWTETLGLRNSRALQGAAENRGKLYAFGGQNAGTSQTFNQYSFNGTNWSSEGGMPALLESMGGATLNRRNYSIGGANSAGVTNQVFRYDGVDWSDVDPLPANRYAMGSAFWRGAIYVIGGDQNSLNPTTNVWMLLDGGVSPISGYPSGGYNVTICGTNLSAGTTGDVTSVTICGATAEVVSVSGSTQIVVTAGSGDVGTGDVVVNSEYYGTITAANAFTYKRGIISLIGTNGAIIESGDAASAANGSDFGTMSVGQTAVTNTFTYYNSGNDTLNLSDVVTAGEGAGSFTVDSYSPTNLVPGATGSITIVCASQGGEQNGEINFRDSVLIDPSIENPFVGHTVCVFRVKSYGTGAGMGSETNQLAFSATYGDANPSTQSITITNTGNDTLTCSNRVVYATAGDNWLTVAPTGGTIAVDGSIIFTNSLDISSLNVGTHYATVQVYSATATNSPYRYSVNVTISQATQTLGWSNPGEQSYTNETDLTATNSGGLTPTYTVASGPATVHYDRYPAYVTYSSTGEVTVVASQAGNMNYTAAPSVTQSWDVTRSAGVITLTNLTQEYTGSAITADVVTSPTDVTYTVTYDGLSAGPTNVGTYEVIALITDPLIYGGVTNTLTITKASQVITFPAIAAQLTNTTVGLTATGGASGNPVTFSVVDGPGVLDTTNLTFSGSGDVLVKASQAGAANYFAAPDVTNLVRAFSITPNNGPLAGGNSVTISNGSLGTVTNVLLGAPSVGSAIPDTTAANWLTLTMPATTNAGLIDITLQSVENGDILVANAYTYNPAGVIAGTVTTQTCVIGTGSLTNSVLGAGPINIETRSQHFQFVYTSNDLASAGLEKDARITQLGLDVVETPYYNLPSFLIRMKHTDAADMSGGFEATGLTVCYSNFSYMPFAGGFDMLDLSTSFVWNGVSNIILDTAFAETAYSSASGRSTYDAIDSRGRMLRDDYDDQSYLFTGGDVIAHLPRLRMVTETASSAVVPSSGSRMGNYPVSIVGTNLGNGIDITNVTLCGVQATISSQAADRVWIMAGASSSGTSGDVVVQSTSFGTTIKSNAFIYLAPTLSVLGTNGAAIPGNAGVSLANGTKFYPVKPSTPDYIYTFAITNTGNDVLTISDCTTNGANPDKFSVVSYPAQVEVGGVSNLEVAYYSTEVGSHTATINFTSDDPNSPFLLNVAGSCYAASTNVGPYAGGNTLTITNGYFGTITNVIVGSAGSASAISSGPNWLTLTMPAANSAGLIDITLQTTENGDILLADAYTYNPAGSIGTDWSQWGEVTPLDTPIISGGYAVLSNTLYCVGGIDATFSEVTNAFAFDGSTWSPISGLPVSLDSQAAAVLDGTLYSIGGYNGSESISNVWSYNGTSWDTAPSLPVELRYHAAATLNGAIYVFGGVQGTTGSAASTNVLRFNGTTWEHAAWLEQEQNNSTAITYDNKIYLLGGSAVAPVTNCYRYDGVSTSLTPVAGPDTPFSLWVAGVVNDKIYVAAGDPDGGPIASTNVYSFDGTTWAAAPALPQARGYAVGGTVNDLFYVAGGGDNSFTACTNVYCYPRSFAGLVPDSGSWTGQYEVVINGSYLGNGSDITNVTLCGVAAAITGQSSTSVTVSAGAATTGQSGDVIVQSTSYGTTTKSNGFTYVAPTLSILGTNGSAIASSADVQSANGSKFYPVKPSTPDYIYTFAITNPGNDVLTISDWTTNGTGRDTFFVMDVPSQVEVGGISNFNVAYYSATVGSHTATVSFVSDDPTSPFLFNLGGSCYDVSTNVGPYAGGNSITITNGNFGTITNVLIGSPSVGSAIPTAQGSSWFTITMPEIGTSGTVDITVQTSDKGDITLTDAYTYNPAGILSVVTPSSGSWTGNYAVALSGTNLCNGNSSDITQVTLAGMTAAVQNVYGSTQIVVVADGSSYGFGTGDVIVTSIDFGATTKSDAFEYLKEAQSITFNAIANRTYGDASFDPSATVSSALPVSYASSDAHIATVSVHNIYITGTGTCDIVASQAGNDFYFVAPAKTNTLTVAQKALTVSGVSASNKIYDASIAAQLSGGALVGLVGADEVSLGNVSTGTFAQATIGLNIEVTSYMTISGGDAGKYTLSQPSGITADITARELTVTGAVAQSKSYDWTTAATLSSTGTLVGVQGSDAITLGNNTTGTFASADVGAAIAVTPYMTISGPKVANYTLTQPTLTADITKASQSISFGGIDNQFWTNKIGLAANASSSGTVTFAVIPGSPATISNATNLSFTGYGSIKITASQSGNANFNAAPTVTNTFTALGPEFILLGTNGAAIASGSADSLSAGTRFVPAIIGLQVLTNIFTLTNNGNATLTISGVTTSGANAASFSLSVTSSTVSTASILSIPITFNPQSGGSNTTSFTFTFNGTNSPYTLNVGGTGLGGGIALATNALSFNATYQSNNPAAQSIAMTNVGLSSFTYTNLFSADWLSTVPNNGTVATNEQTAITNSIDITGLNAGIYSATCSVTAIDATNSPQQIVVSLTVDKASQGITFDNPGSQLTTNETQISATSTSGLPVTFTLISGPASLSGSTSPASLTYTNSGTVVIRASQAGNTNWYEAPAVTQTFTVAKTPQTALVFTPPTPQTFATTNALATTGGSGTGNVSYAVESGAGQIVNSTNLTMLKGTGTVTVVATKASDDIYLSTATTATVSCAKANQTITFNALSDTFWTNRPILSATASSGMTVNFGITDGPATLSNANTLVMNGYGSVTVQATQPGDDRYNAAPSVPRTFTALGPEFTLLGTNGAAIASGSADSLSAGTRFVPAIIGLQVLTNTFTLTNSGNATLTISGVTTSGANAASFSLSVTSSTVSTASILSIPITFNPQTGGSNTASFTFTFDGTNSPYTLNVGGFGLGGGISLATQSLAYTCTYLGADPESQSITMTNVGLSGFTFTNEIPASWLAALPSADIVPLNGSTSLTFTVMATNLNAGTYVTTNTIQSIDATNAPQDIVVSLTVDKSSQSISLPNPGAQITTNTTLLTGTASSGLPVSYTLLSGPAVLGYTTNTTYMTYTNSGTVVVQASQAGNSNWLAANSVTQTFAVTKAVASVSLTNLTQTYDRGVHTATVTCVPSVPYTVTYNGSASAPVNAGSYTVVATAVDPIWQGGATNTLTIQKSAQTVTFPGIDSQKTTNLVVLAASASSGYPVAFAVNYGPAVIGGFSNMTFTGAGMVSVDAVQAGNSNWLAAGATNTFSVLRADQTPLVFAPASPQIYDTTNQLTISGGSGTGLVTYALISGPGLLTNDLFKMTSGTGTAVLAVTKSSDAYYNSASATSTVAAWRAAQSALVFNPTNVMAYNALQSLTTSGGSGTGGVTFAVTSGPGEILVGPRLWVKSGTGIVTVVATKAQDENYFVTANTQQVTAVQAAQVISGFTPVDGTSFGVSEEVTLSATASSGRSVTYAVVSGPASLSGNTMTFTGVGTVAISAGEPGDADWSAASTLTNQYTVLAAPGLTVLGTNGTTIASGSAISLNKGTDFQGYALGSVLTNTFSITNNGDQNLVISSVVLSGLTNVAIRLDHVPTVVNAKSAATFNVVFAPQMQGRFSGFATMLNNSPVSPFTLNLGGIGFVPSNTLSALDGPAAGGLLTISNLTLGSGTDITNALLGGVPAIIQSQTSNSVQLLIPAMSEGLYDISLQSTSLGLTLLHNAYTVNPAGTVDELNPAEAGGAGGVQVVLTGTNLSSGTLSDILGVTLCGVTTIVDSVSGSTQIVVTAGSGGVGSGSAVIHSETFGWIVVSNAFTYNAPGMRILGPSSNVVASGAAATVDAGNDFGTLRLNAGATNAFEIMNYGNRDLVISGVAASGDTDRFGFTAQPMTVAAGTVSNVTLTYNSGTNAGSFNANYTLSNNTVGTPAYTFNVAGGCFNPADSMSSADGPKQGGNYLTISNILMGSGSDITSVLVGGRQAMIVGQGSNWIRIILPEYFVNLRGASPDEILATVDVSIESASRGTTTLRDSYDYNQPGTITGISPNFSTTGGAQVVISGSNLCSVVNGTNDITALSICGVAAVVDSSSSETQVVAHTGAGGFGQGDVIIWSESHGRTVGTNLFMLAPAAPTVQSATDGSSAGFTAHWLGVNSATNYLVDVAAGATNNLIQTGTLAGTNLQLSVSLSGSTNHTFAYRLRAQNSVAISEYSAWSPWLTVGAPDISGMTVTHVSMQSATVQANITATNGGAVVNRGFCYSTNLSFEMGDAGVSNWTESGSFGTGIFTNKLTGLSNGTFYAVRAFAGNDDGTNVTARQTFQTDAPASLLHRWQFESNLVDSVGGANGTSNGASSYVDGPVRGVSALSLSSDAYVDLPAITLPEKFSLSVWAYVDPATTNIQTILSNSGAGERRDGFKWYVNSFPTTDGAVIFEQGNGLDGSYAGRSSTNAASAGAWQHLVCIVDTTSDTGLTMYRNGTNVTANASLGYAFQRTNVMAIGAMLDPSYEFNGSLADLQIYRGLLTAQEVADIRDSMKGVTLPGILVMGTNGAPVLSESLTSLASGTDFGAMTNGAVAIHTLTVTNTGENTLTLSAAALSGDGASAFTVSALAGDIEEGGTTNFTVQFTAAASQCYQATLLITNNAAQPYELALSGRGFTVTPNDGPAVGGTSITVESDPLGGDVTNVLVGGKSAVFSNQTAKSVLVTTPSGNGAQDIVIQSPSLGDITLPNAYLYHPTGYIISVDPAACTETGGVPVQVIGTNLCANADDIVSVSLCGVAATVNGLGEGDNNSQAIQITAGDGGAGIGNVVVVSTRYGTSILSNGFTYLTRPSAPVMLPATDMAATSFTANWNPAAHATGYVFEAAWDESFTNIVSGYSNRWNGALTSVAVTNLLEQYSNVYVRARGVNAIGTGSWSSVQTVLLRSTFTNVAVGLDMSIVNMTTNYQQGLVYVDYLFSNNAASHNVLAEPFWFSAPSNSLYYLAKPDGTAPDGNPYVNCTAQFDAKLGGQTMNPGDAVTVTNIPFYFFTLQRQQVDGTLWASQREAWSAPVAADLTIRVIPGTNYTGQLSITGDARTPLTYARITPATNGNVDIQSSGSFLYVAPTNRGRDTFTFTVSNIDGSSTGTVRVIIQKNSGLPWLMLLLGD